MLRLRFTFDPCGLFFDATDARRSCTGTGFAFGVVLNKSFFSGDSVGNLMGVSAVVDTIFAFCCVSGVTIVSARRLAPRVAGASIGGKTMMRPSLRFTLIGSLDVVGVVFADVVMIFATSCIGLLALNPDKIGLTVFKIIGCSFTTGDEIGMS